MHNIYIKYTRMKHTRKYTVALGTLLLTTSWMLLKNRNVITDTYNSGDDTLGLARSSAEVLSRLLGPLTNDDPSLLQYIKERVLIEPSTETYNLQVDLDKTNTDAYKYNSYRRDHNWKTLNNIVKTIFDNEPAGFYVEAGALDGEYLSNSLYLERDLGWSGLLVEATGDSFDILMSKHRKAWAAHACLASYPYSHTASLVKLSKQGHHLEPQEKIGLQNHNALMNSPGLQIR
ncbi:unnamed protein product, partial [Meganyctiphanes norvegica]